MSFALVVAGCTQGAEPPATAAKPRKPDHLVELSSAARETLRMKSIYTGSLRNRRSVRIFTQEGGTISALPYYEGDRVDNGNVVVQLDNRLLKSELNKASAVRRQAEANFERFSKLRAPSLVSEDQYIRAETELQVAIAEEKILHTRLGYTSISAPFAGIVSMRAAEPGDFVERNAHVLTIVDPSSLIAELQVSELVIPHVNINDAVRVRIDALGDAPFNGRVLRIHPQLNAATRQGRVEIELDPVPVDALAGQFARVALSVRAPDRLAIPFSGLRRDREGEYVFRMSDERVVNRVAVTSGRRFADRVEITDGLNEGDSIVAKGFLGLSSGKTVRPVERPRGGAEAADE